jgi:hypothetical protein
VDDENIYVTKVKVVFSDTYVYAITSDGTQTSLNIDSNQFGLMVRDGGTAETGAAAFPGLWLSKNSISTTTPIFTSPRTGAFSWRHAVRGLYRFSNRATPTPTM